MSFWDVFWFIVLTYVFVAYLMVMFSVIGDIFRGRSTGGVIKASWTLALILVPVVSLLVYLAVRGRGMAERSQEQLRAAQESQEAYIREVARADASHRSTTPVEQVAQAKALLDSGAISSAEFDSIKARALTGTAVLS